MPLKPKKGKFDKTKKKIDKAVKKYEEGSAKYKARVDKRAKKARKPKQEHPLLRKAEHH